MNLPSAERYHDISCGHRVHGHESKCAHLHGHNYRVHFECIAPSGLDQVGRVIDFSVMKAKLCNWLEEHWDHKFLAWESDYLLRSITVAPDSMSVLRDLMVGSIVWVPFNPTAENMADYLLRTIGPQQLEGTGVTLRRVRIDETRKCSATVAL